MLYLKDGRTAHIIFYCGSELNILLVSWHWNMFDQSSLNISAQKEEEITICGFKGCKIWILKFCVEIVGMTASLIIILSERTCSQFSYWQWLLVDNYVVTNLPQHNSSVKSPHETKFANIPLSIHGTSKSPEKVVMGLILLYIPLIQSTGLTFSVQFNIVIQTVGDQSLEKLHTQMSNGHWTGRHYYWGLSSVGVSSIGCERCEWDECMLISQSVGSEQWRGASSQWTEHSQGGRKTFCSPGWLLTDSNCNRMPYSAANWILCLYHHPACLCLATPASPIITTKIINYLSSQLNWAIFNWQTTIVAFSPINMRFLTNPSFLSSWFSKYCPDKWCMRTSHSSSFTLSCAVLWCEVFAFIFFIFIVV